MNRRVRYLSLESRKELGQQHRAGIHSWEAGSDHQGGENPLRKPREDRYLALGQPNLKTLGGDEAGEEAKEV